MTLAIATLASTLVVFEPVVGELLGLRQDAAFASAPPTSITLTTDKSQIAAGESATLTAVTDVDVAGSASTIRILDQTAGTTLKSCTTGTTCSITSTFTSGGPHNYVATVSSLTSTPVTVQRLPWTASLSVDKTAFAAGEPVTMTATTNQDVGNTSGKYATYIFDATTGSRLIRCTTGTTCTYAVAPFQVGPPHDFVAVVAISAAPTYTSTSDVQATSTPVTVSRLAWSVTLTTNKPAFAVGESVTLTATANQNVGSTSSNYKFYVFDQTSGALVGSCTTGSTCAISSTAFISSGPPHDFVAYVAKPGATTIAALQDIQSTSNVVTISRLTWTLTLSTDLAVFASGQTPKVTATANQSVNSSFRIYIFDRVTGAQVATCSSGSTCVFTVTGFYTGGPRTYIAVVAPTATYANYAAVTNAEAISNEVTVSRQPWTASLSVANAEFATGTHPIFTVTPNQSITGSGLVAYVFDTTTGTRESYCNSGSTCTITGSWYYTGGAHHYVAVVGTLNTNAQTPADVANIQVTSNEVTTSRKPWTVSIDGTVAPASTLHVQAHPNQGYSYSAYKGYILDATTGATVWTSTSIYAYASVRRNTGHVYVAYVASNTDNTYPYTDVQAISGAYLAYDDGGPMLADESNGGKNASEKACQCSHNDPVNTATGEFYLPATDIGITGVGPSFNVGRTYSSKNADTDGAFGFGWAPNFNTRLETLMAGDSLDPLPRQVQIVQENGSTAFFAEVADGKYIAPARVMATLVFDVPTQTFIFTRTSSEVMTFDLNGTLLSVKSMQGVAMLIGHDTAGRVTGMSASGGRSMSFVWTGNHITQIADSAGRTVSYGYDSAGNLTSATGMDGRVTSYGYDAAHYMTSVTTPGGRTTTNVYDSAHRVITQTDPIGQATSFSYDTTTGITTITAPDGSKIVETYTNSQLTSQTKAATTGIAATTSNAWDSAGNMISSTDPLGNVTTFTYDADGNMLTKIDPLLRVTQWTYDVNRHVTSTKDAMGRETTFAYDSTGNLVLTTFPSGKHVSWTFNANGTVATTTNASGKITSYAYDAAGRMTSATDPDGRTSSIGYNAAGIVTSKTAPGGASTTITPDAVGRPITVVDPNGHETGYTYSTAGDLLLTLDAAGHTTSSTYDAAGQVLTSTDAAGKITTYTYTAAGYLASVKDANNHTTANAYDALGRVVSTTDPLSRTTTYAYDLGSHLLSTTLPSGAVSSAAYDTAGQLTQTTNALGKSSSFTYNLAGRPVSSTDQLGRVTSTSYTTDGLADTVTLPGNNTQHYEFNADGQPVAFTNGDGNETTYSYSNAGALLSKTEPGGLTTAYLYDAANRPSVVTRPDGSTATYGYDSAGQLLHVDYSGTVGVDVTYAYDSVGQPLSMTDSTGTSGFVYDPAGRLTSETNGAGATTRYGYDDIGQLTSMTYPGNRTAAYGYDAAGQMTSLTDWASHTTAFTWTPDGQLATQVTPDGVTQTNGYDLAGRLTGIADATTVQSLAQFGYGYDDAGQLVASSSILNGATVSRDYGYDPLSQLTNVTTTVSGQSPTVATPSATPGGLLTGTVGGGTVAYNAAQQATSLTPAIGTATDFGYDARGSRTSATTGTDATTYAYTSSGSLASVSTPSMTVSYTSDGRGLRQSRTVGTATTQFTWSGVGGLPLLLDDGGHAYLYGPSSTPLAQVDDGTGDIEYLHADLLGTPRLVTDESGDAVGTATYDAFGTLGEHTGIQSAFGLTGNLVDETTGLLYLRARDYDPTTGQFLTVDPAVDSTRQPYAYTGNNPTSRTDPTGLCVGIEGSTQERPCDGWDYFAESGMAFWAGGADGVGFNIPMLLDCTSYHRYSNNGWYWAGDVVGGLLAAVTLTVAADIRLSSFIGRTPAASGSFGEVLTFESRTAAREGLPGDLLAAGNRFFRGATSKSQDFRATPLANGAYRLEFFSPANTPGYGKLYVQEIDSAGHVLSEYKNTMGPDGLIETKWVHGGP